MTVDVVVHPDAEALAASVASRLIAAIRVAQDRHGDAGVVLTGGGIGENSQAAVAADPSRRTVDWSRVDLYWGDERFLPTGDPQRNHTQSAHALLSAVGPDPARVHAMPASDGQWGADAAAAAAGHWAQLVDVARSQSRHTPRFDILLLGVGPDGHVASLFPHHPVMLADGAGVVAVFGSPKPPPTRLSFTMPLIRTAEQVWLVAAGAEKAEALARALAPDADPGAVPAARAVGRQRTLVLLDAAAASLLGQG